MWNSVPMFVVRHAAPRRFGAECRRCVAPSRPRHSADSVAYYKHSNENDEQFLRFFGSDCMA